MLTVAADEVRQELKSGEKPKEFICLGCAAKVELVSTVYPAISQVAAWIRANAPHIRLQPRDDAYIFDTDGAITVERRCYSVSELEAGRFASVTRDFSEIEPDGIIVLANFLPFPTIERLVKLFTGFYRAAAAANHPFTVGKGHTIQIAKTASEEYVIIDFVKSKGSKFYGLGNNDTISNIDPNLKYSSWIGIFVAMNNSINDLFLCGVYKDIEVYPTFDARDPADIPEISAALEKYAKKFSAIGINVHPVEALGFSTKSIGATVFSKSDREVPLNQNLLEGQVILATRPIGDLAPLTEFLIRQSVGEDISDLLTMREKVLGIMLTPNNDAARVINSFLPPRGSKFDPSIHITSCRDMSGPGILALEELAEDSMVNIYLDNVKLHEEWIAGVEMPNPTSGTNGAIVITAFPAVAKRAAKELRSAGYDPWVMGTVMGKSDNPEIQINEALAKYPFIKGYRGSIYKNSTLVPARKIDG